MNFATLDWIAIGVPFAMVVVVAWSLQRYMHSVADFLAANRCAGRYLICSAIAEGGSSVMVMLTMLEVFSKTGFSLNFWSSFSGIILFFFGLLGLMVYRFRETRAMTFHQFFEKRYSKGVRVLACFLHVFSGLFNFGVQPAVGARFFVYFCGIEKGDTAPYWREESRRGTLHLTGEKDPGKQRGGANKGATRPYSPTSSSPNNDQWPLSCVA